MRNLLTNVGKNFSCYLALTVSRADSSLNRFEVLFQFPKRRRRGMKQSKGYTIRFHGFHPSDYVKDVINTKMSELLEEAPEGAQLKASFTQKGEEFRGVVNLRSANRQIVSLAANPNMHTAISKLSSHIRRQLGKWKSMRYRPLRSGRRYLRNMPFSDENDTVA
jgi:ribosome-associated translation inhibitor RaiA